MPTRWHMMSEKQLSILIQGRNYARGNRQIIRIPRAFACISAGAPWLWRSVMQIDKVSQEPARLRMLTAPFHGTFFSIGSSTATTRFPDNDGSKYRPPSGGIYTYFFFLYYEKMSICYLMSHNWKSFISIGSCPCSFKSGNCMDGSRSST